MARSKLTQKFIVVRGHLAFPLDMLRYDACYPDTEQDSLAMTRTIIDRSNMTWVVLRQDEERSHQAANWTPARWRSFGWEVVLVEQERGRAQEFAEQERRRSY